MKLYHGSTFAVRNPSALRGRANTDFGRGFYTTTSVEQAEKWALIKKNRAGDTAARAIVSVYDFDEALLSDAALRVMHFSEPTAGWLDFVVGNRRGVALHDYDLVMGPVANDKLYATIQLYEQGILSAAAAIDQLQTHILFDQLSFHTKQACGQLLFSSAAEVGE